ncbi:uncharacterized protein EDB91DRAFT_1088480 [Suillus paluster]|uniref:uncharacterized protein n=1 Tax=Suillus paluster TaxID=48578 RepID=UPI001B870C3D|nr:uncharacterized protein EDB91DRAFT_1088480 [Suillus paluster]KAG1721303.1 hypothetical protein EDB91DRAFT_1088480 [Suillus paluster]
MSSMAGISEGPTKFTGAIELNNKGKSFTTVGNPCDEVGSLLTHLIFTVAPISPFVSVLEDMIQEQYDRADDCLDSDDEGDELTRDVNMRVRRRMKIARNGIQAMVYAAFAMLRIPKRVVRRQPAHDHDAGEEDEYSREQRLVERLDEIEQEMDDSMATLQMVRRVTLLADALAKEVQKVKAECANWDDSISERKRTVNRRMDSIADIAEQIMASCQDAFQPYRTQDKHYSQVWSVIYLCRDAGKEVDEVQLHSLNW